MERFCNIVLLWHPSCIFSKCLQQVRYRGLLKYSPERITKNLRDHNVQVVQPALDDNLNINDSCGVHNLHGPPHPHHHPRLHLHVHLHL